MKKITAALIAISFALSPLPAVSDAWQRPLDNLEVGQSSFFIDEGRVYQNGSFLRLHSIKNGEFWVETCAAFAVADCPKSLLNSLERENNGRIKMPYLSFDLLMPSCVVSVEKDWCIEDARFYSSTGSGVSATFLESAAGFITEAEPSVNVPAGGTMPLYSAGPGSGFEGLQFAVSARMTFTPLATRAATGVAYRPTEVEFSVLPYRMRTLPRPGEEGFGNGRWLCLYGERDQCAALQDFPTGSRVGLTIRSRYEIKEFFSGRLANTDLEVNKQGSITTLKIDADPVVVPTLYSVFDESTGIRGKLGIPRPGPSQFQPYSPTSIGAIAALRDHVRDTATAISSHWRLSAIGVSGFPCYEGTPFSGLVTTNAMAYDGIDPPKLVDGFIDYRVAGLHYLPNGKDLVEGSYELILRSEVARCLYGYTRAPVSAKVSVIGVSGEQKVATTEVSERDGWLQLSAQGFTFSENKIRAEIKGTSNAISGTRPSPVTSFPRFASKVSKLNTAQRAALKSLVMPSSKTVTCTAKFSNSRNAALARLQAKATCAEAKKIAKKAKTVEKIQLHLGGNFDGVVEVRVG